MKRLIASISLMLLLGVSGLQAGCGYVAAGAAGAVIGHEAAERNDDDEDE